MFIWFSLPMTFDLLRALLGPLSRPACLTGIFLKNVTSFNVSLIMVALTSTKLTFIFAFKRIPIMDDKFWANFLYMTTSLISVLASACRFYQPGRPVLNEVIYFDQRKHLQLHRFFILLHFSLFALDTTMKIGRTKSRKSSYMTQCSPPALACT